jgi:signal transduction histidine kinase
MRKRNLQSRIQSIIVSFQHHRATHASESIPIPLVVIAGFLWGAGPALLTMTLAILAISYVIIPQYELLTLNIWNDITLLGPFVFVQILITLLAAQNAVHYRRTIAAKQEIQAYAQRLAATNRQLERANRLKDYFFTRAAHELRTPLTTILGEAQFALRRLDNATPNSLYSLDQTADSCRVWIVKALSACGGQGDRRSDLGWAPP